MKLITIIVIIGWYILKNISNFYNDIIGDDNDEKYHNRANNVYNNDNDNFNDNNI